MKQNEKSVSLFRSLRSGRRSLLTPIVSVGFGPLCQPLVRHQQCHGSVKSVCGNGNSSGRNTDCVNTGKPGEGFGFDGPQASRQSENVDEFSGVIMFCGIKQRIVIRINTDSVPLRTRAGVVYVCQAVAAGESIPSNDGHTVRNRYACQAAAAIESTAANTGHIVRDRDTLQTGAV